MNHEVLTTSTGILVGDDQNTITTGERGPVLIQDFHLTGKLAHFNRERIPARTKLCVTNRWSGASITATMSFWSIC